jgi:RNA polymerase primary sigma factor
MTETLVQDVSTAGGEENIAIFLREIRAYPRLTEQEELELAKRCAQGDEEAVRTMVSANLRLVVAIAKRYYNGSVPLLDLIQEGAIGLLTAARKFDFSRQVRFSTYAAKWIRQGVMRYIVNNCEPIRVPAHTADLIRRVTLARDELTQQLRREPELSQIAQAVQLPEEKVHQLLQMQRKTFSLEAQYGDEEIEPTIEDLQAPQPLEELVREELVRTMDQLLAMLEPRQREILRLHFGMDSVRRLSLDEIGSELGISKERVRQIEKQAMEKLKKLGADMGLEDFLDD